MTITGLKAQKTVDSAQVTGHIYDDYQHKTPLRFYKVKTSGGRRTFSDQKGFYKITLTSKDTVYIYNTQDQLIVTYPAAYMLFYHSFNVYVKEQEFKANGAAGTYHPLSTVTVKSRNYKEDSLKTRKLYKDIFEYKKPTLGDAITVPKIGKVPIPVSIGISVSGLVRWLQTKKNNKDQRSRDFAHYSEDQLYIRYRVSDSKIENYTGLKDMDSIAYLRLYLSPDAVRLRDMNELELGMYLIGQLKKWEKGQLPSGVPDFSEYRKEWAEDKKR